MEWKMYSTVIDLEAEQHTNVFHLLESCVESHLNSNHVALQKQSCISLTVIAKNTNTIKSGGERNE